MVLFGFITRRIEHCKQKTIGGAQIMWDNFFKGGMFALVAATAIWISVFLYIAFYYYYMPSVSHHRQVYLQFKTCEEKGSGMCSYPSAHVQLTKFQQLLMIGQTYRIFLRLEMPESQANRNLGMFMVCAQLADKNGIMVSQSCRSAMLHYRSELLTYLTTLTFYPFLVFGNSEQKQILTLELYSNFEEDQNHPVTDVYVELQAQHIEYYSASIHIQAHLKGLRYLMFHWPLATAALGICSNLFFIVFIASVSWWQVQVRGSSDDYGSGMYPRMSLGYFFGRNLLVGDLDYDQDDDVYEEEELTAGRSSESESSTRHSSETSQQSNNENEEGTNTSQGSSERLLVTELRSNDSPPITTT